MRRSAALLVAGLACVPVLLAGCSGGGSDNAADSSPSPAASSAQPSPTSTDTPTTSVVICVGSDQVTGAKARVTATVDGKKAYDKQVKVGQAFRITGLGLDKKFVVAVNGQKRISGTTTEKSDSFYFFGKGCPETAPAQG